MQHERNTKQREHIVNVVAIKRYKRSFKYHVDTKCANRAKQLILTDNMTKSADYLACQLQIVTDTIHNGMLHSDLACILPLLTGSNLKKNASIAACNFQMLKYTRRNATRTISSAFRARLFIKNKCASPPLRRWRPCLKAMLSSRVPLDHGPEKSNPGHARVAQVPA